jgi:hypothetical protein
MKTLVIAAVSAAVLSVSALAGSGPHRMPATAPAAAPAYLLQLDGPASADRPLIVSLVDRATGVPVTGGAVAMMRPVYRGPKAVPGIQWVAQTLPRTADGHFVCAAEHHASGVTLRGEGPSGETWLSVPVHS